MAGARYRENPPDLTGHALPRHRQTLNGQLLSPYPSDDQTQSNDGNNAHCDDGEER
jgi:hypothetical protein